MVPPRQLPLYDAGHKPETWNERMVPGEYAVHYSSFEDRTSGAPYCTVFTTLQEAVDYAQEQIEKRVPICDAPYTTTRAWSGLQFGRFEDTTSKRTRSPHGFEGGSAPFFSLAGPF